MSYRPLALYEPDSDDSSDDEQAGVGGLFGSGAAMGIAGYSLKEETMSLDSDLFEDFTDDEMMPSGMNEAAKYGKGLDVDKDTKDVDEDTDYSVPTLRTKLAVGVDDDEESIGSDDEFVPQTVKNTPKTLTKNDKDFDALIPTASTKGAQGIRTLALGVAPKTQAARLTTTGAGREASVRITEQALAHARASRPPATTPVRPAAPAEAEPATPPPPTGSLKITKHNGLIDSKGVSYTIKKLTPDRKAQLAVYRKQYEGAKEGTEDHKILTMINKRLRITSPKK
jgi:hypothetical protein